MLLEPLVLSLERSQWVSFEILDIIVDQLWTVVDRVHCLRKRNVGVLADLENAWLTYFEKCLVCIYFARLIKGNIFGIIKKCMDVLRSSPLSMQVALMITSLIGTEHRKY